jgi:hypothetical protein
MEEEQERRGGGCGGCFAALIAAAFRRPIARALSLRLCCLVLGIAWSARSIYRKHGTNMLRIPELKLDLLSLITSSSRLRALVSRQ